MKAGHSVVMMFAVIAAGALVFPAVASSSNTNTPQVQADTKAKLEIAAAEVRREMVPRGRSQFLSKEEFSTVNTNPDPIGSLFDKYGAVANMDHVVKLALFNDQEVVNGILAQRDDLRLICKRVRRTGTRLPITDCQTYGDIQRAQAATHNNLDKFFQIYQQRQPKPAVQLRRQAGLYRGSERLNWRCGDRAV